VKTRPWVAAYVPYLKESHDLLALYYGDMVGRCRLTLSNQR